uniref:Uncharacterized protein n=1 Tax=Arundo donax TaxID=35708 RepID=A0A0A9GTH3_ARUDO
MGLEVDLLPRQFKVHQKLASCKQIYEEQTRY